VVPLSKTTLVDNLSRISSFSGKGGWFGFEKRRVLIREPYRTVVMVRSVGTVRTEPVQEEDPSSEKKIQVVLICRRRPGQDQDMWSIRMRKKRKARKEIKGSASRFQVWFDRLYSCTGWVAISGRGGDVVCFSTSFLLKLFKVHSFVKTKVCKVLIDVPTCRRSRAGGSSPRFILTTSRCAK
jgi:hypothetical protein